MTSEMKVRTNKQDQLKKTSLMREKLSKSLSLQGSLLNSPSLCAAKLHLNCAYNSPLTLKYKRECYNNYVYPNNQITNS